MVSRHPLDPRTIAKEQPYAICESQLEAIIKKPDRNKNDISKNPKQFVRRQKLNYCDDTNGVRIWAQGEIRLTMLDHTMAGQKVNGLFGALWLVVGR